MIHDICIGKTGTITEGVLTVKKFHLFESNQVENNNVDKYYS
jgi:magnesium-transporting ATPase (P-type)